MKITRFGIILVLSSALGFSVAACKSLNPNTEGQILSALEAKMSEFKGCYQSALDRNRDTKGTIGLKLKVHETSGAVTSSSIETTTITDNEMNQCVANAASDITLPEAPGVDVEGHYSINFAFE